jgi:hypothetical protein
LEAISYCEYAENILEVQSEQLPPLLPQTEMNASTCSPLSNYIAVGLERDPLGCLVMNLHTVPTTCFPMCKENKYIEIGIKNNGKKTSYGNRLMEDIMALHFLSFNKLDGVQKLMASMPSDQAVREWELLTPKDMK